MGVVCVWCVCGTVCGIVCGVCDIVCVCVCVCVCCETVRSVAVRRRHLVRISP